MSLQLRLFGGGQSNAGKLSATNDGSHSIDKNKVLASTDTGVITPNNPGNFSSIRSVPVVPNPRYFDREQADKLKELAKEKTDGARQSKRAYNALTKIEEADASQFTKIPPQIRRCGSRERAEARSDQMPVLAKKLHGLRPGYARLGLGIDKAENERPHSD